MKKFIVNTVLFTALCVVCAQQAAAVSFSWAPYARLRHEYWKNIFDMNNATADDRNFYRFKFSLSGQADFSKNFGVTAKLTNESKAYIYYAGGDATYNINEAVFDNLYADIRNIAGLPLDLRLGRQDLTPGMYGEGFILGDGTPLDGSRTFYFNAVKASWKFNQANVLDGLYIADYKYDTMLPVINEVPGKQQLNSTDERAFGLYHKGDLSPALHLEDYYLWKHEDAGGTLLSTRETTLNTLGSFVRYATLPWLTFRGQLAYQFGTYGSDDRTGLGGYAFGDVSLKTMPGSPQFSAGYIYLSGDDRSTAKNEAWDPLFSRWPWMSELYVLSYTREAGTGYWTNLKMARIGMLFTPLKKTKVQFAYNILTANETAAGTVFGTGTDRGKLYQGRVDYSFTKNITAYFLADYFTPGNFYAASDPAMFLRTELQFKY